MPQRAQLFAQLVPLPVALPLLVAALLGALGAHLPRRLLDTVALLTVAAITACGIFLLHATSHATLIYWLGNWSPTPAPASPSLFPVGVCFIVDPFAAGLVAIIGLLSFAAFAFSWLYFEEVKSFYHTLMLVFAAAMCGLCLSGDLFNLFVWFELMTVAAISLCGYKSEERRPLLGALNFAVVNTVAAFLSLAGVALLYAQTGSLNLLEVGRTLVLHPPNTSFVLITFLFVGAGFLVKMAAVPFHFWLADAHAVAPTPVCVLFSGIMVELGLYAVARLYATVFAPTLPPHSQAAVRSTFIIIGASSAVAAALYCFGQRHLKRMLAFSSISHVGLMTMGFALLDPAALGGAAVYLLGHALVKGALFLGAGILLHRCGTVDEYDLRGKTSSLRPLALLFAAGGLALAGLPPFALFLGASQIQDAASRLGFGGLASVSVLAGALTGGAVLRFAARAFLGWGKTPEASSRGAPHIPMDPETAGEHDTTPLFMWLPPVALLLLASVIALPPQLRSAITPAAQRFLHPDHLLTQNAAPTPAPTPPEFPEAALPSPVAFHLDNALSVLAAGLLALLALFPLKRPRRPLRFLRRRIQRAMNFLRRFQSGNVSDYVAWLIAGIVFYTLLLLLFAG